GDLGEIWHYSRELGESVPSGGTKDGRLRGVRTTDRCACLSLSSRRECRQHHRILAGLSGIPSSIPLPAAASDVWISGGGCGSHCVGTCGGEAKNDRDGHPYRQSSELGAGHQSRAGIEREDRSGDG